ncbi:snRNA-activating protein complex subunit 4 isoform X2 [Chelmon rostratus]|uniref:snRNA-activating protein complex subunit 4 isoform X2 n=1 Tax=Chelmon rostratus TaxID=109905 RepID=UPI001BE9AC5F|nr:snRNA-activating protein complex subunit 4 isoform X2 [Chelmon rostratus]
MSVSLSAERDRIQRQVEELEQSLSATHTELELLSSETDDESDGDDMEDEAEQSAAGLLAQREKIQKEIQNLENVLGPHSPVCVSDDDSSSSEESELGLSLSVDSCLQMNLVYQQVVQETLDQLETLLTHNHRQQKEVMSQLTGPIKESPREQRPPSSCQQPVNMFLGRFLKPYFKDKLTGLGPPANQETKEKANRMTCCLDNQKLKVKRWESWQKTLLIHSVARDGLRRLTQPKLSKVDYLSQKLLSAEETDRQQLRQQIDSLEREIDLLRGKKEEELIGDRYEEHDWQKISNVDFEGTRDAEDIRSFWQNFLHPSVNKTRWSQEEVQQLREVSRRHGERHWETIATELGTGRTAFLCLQTFQRFVSDSLRRGSWTRDEDALLRELVDKMRIGNFIPYTQMSYFMEGRDPAQLIYRWNQVLDPSLKKGPWTKEEDQLLLQAVSCHGEKNWWKIRLEVPGRTDSACRDRYYDCLKADTKRGAFDKQERELLLQLVEKHGVGRWAKIAAEIPHRFDAQCLREWRKLSRSVLPPAQEDNKAKKTQRRKPAKKVAPGQRRIRRRWMKPKEDEELEEEEETREEEELVVEYMDSDEEEKKNKKKIKEIVDVVRTEKVEEEEKEYTIPPIEEWTPAEKSQCFTFLSFRPVELPSSGDGRNGKSVRSTILGQFGRSVIIGPSPRELQREKRHSSSAMMMVSPDQLRAHLHRQAHKFNNVSSGPRGKVRTRKQNHNRRVTDTGLDCELQAAVTPWIGNLLIPAKTRLTVSDIMREKGEKTQQSSTPIFLLLLQTMNVDSVGCKEMIEQRRNRVALLTPPPDPSSVWKKTPKTIARILQQRDCKEDLQELVPQHKLILSQLQALQQQEKQKQQQLVLKQELPQQLMLLQQPPLPQAPQMSLQSHPGTLLQMPPNVHPQMSPALFPLAVFISHPVTQPHTTSIQLTPPSSLTSPPPAPCRPPPAVVITSPLPAPHRLNVPPASVVAEPLNTKSSCSASFSQQTGPFTQNPLPSSPDQHVSIGSTLPSPAPTPSSSILNPLKGRGPQLTEDQQAVYSSQNEVALGGAGNGVSGACTGLDGTHVIKEGRRIRKMSLKVKVLQEAIKARAEAKKKAALSPQKKAQIQNRNPPQTVVHVPPQQVCPAPVQLRPQSPEGMLRAAVVSSALTKTEASSLLSAQETSSPPLRLDVPPVSASLSPLSQNTTPARSDRTQNHSVVPPPSVPTTQHTASSFPAPFQNDHDYTFLKLGPTHSQHRCDSVQPSPAPEQPEHKHRKSDPAPHKSPKAPSRGTKRARKEEQPGASRSQADQCVGGTGGAVGGTGTAMTQKGKRVRKPSQKARALQEATQAKDEAKKKRMSSSSSPHKKRLRPSGCKQEVVIQNQPVVQLPEFCLCPGQSMWVMTPGGLVQLAEAPRQCLKLAVAPSPPLSAPPENILSHQSSTPPLRLTAAGPRSVAPQPTSVSIPINLPGLNQPHPLPAPPTCPSKSLPPAFILKPVPNPSSSSLPCRPQPRPKLFLPYKGTVRADPAAPPPLRREALQFDPSLMFLEPRAAVCDWLSGRGGVVVPGAGVALPYLPPFISSLSTLSALLQARKSLTKSSLQLLCRGSQPRHPQTKPEPGISTKRTSCQPPDLPDSTSDLRPAADKPAPSVSSDLLQEEAEEEELVAAVRQLVAERFSDNPAYQLLKARFLSCFTVPALLATVQPITKKTVVHQDSEEEEDEEEEEVMELKKNKERGERRRGAERSSLLCDESGAPANQFSGIMNSNTPTTDQTRPDRTGPDQQKPDRQCPMKTINVNL